MDEIDDYDWLFEKELSKLRQKIRFKDRIEYRIGGKLHNTGGPAVIEFSGWDGRTTDTEHYFIKGDEMTKEQWSVLVRPLKLKRLIKKSKEGIE